MRQPRTVAVVGIGLIGGSLCRALRQVRPGLRIEGIDRSSEVAAHALGLGLCDGTGTAPAALADADLVVLCTPVNAMEDWLQHCAIHARPGTGVTDCGSTKGWVQRRATEVLGQSRPFLGGHPMAGRERSGLAAAQLDLFRDRPWVFTPVDGVTLSPFEFWVDCVRDMGASVEVMTPLEHDEAVASVSHLPFVLSAALMHSAATMESWPRARYLAATGFRDVGRLASGDPTMHASIADTNAIALRVCLDVLRDELNWLSVRLADGDGDRLRVLEEWFMLARDLRERWLEDRRSLGGS